MKQTMKYLINVICLQVIISLILVNGWKKKPFNMGLNQQQQQQRPMGGLMNPFRPVPMMMSECCACTPCCACPEGGGGGNNNRYGSNNGGYGSNGDQGNKYSGK